MDWKNSFPKENRYFETENGILYCGDCLEIMKQSLKDVIDLVLTDPPYGITKAEWDKRPNKQFFDSLLKIGKKQIIFGGHFFDLPKKDGWIIWNKKPFLKTTNQAELIWTSFLKRNRIVDFLYAGNCVGTRKPNYRREKVYFTSQKPVEFMEILLEDYSKEKALILDPFLGSGTTAIACEKLNRRWIGIELEEKYCKIAKARIEAIQDSLFSPK